MDDLNIFPLFSSPLAAVKLQGLDNKKILDIIRVLEASERKAQATDQPMPDMLWEKYNGSNVINTSDQQVLSVPELSDIKEQIDNAMDHYLHDVLCFVRDVEFYLATSWAVMHKPDEFTNEHVHKNSLYSFVYYVNVDPENGGDIKFHNPLATSTYIPAMFTIDTTKDTLLNSNEFSLRPEEGLLVMFPSSLKHSVVNNPSKVMRYSISGNYFVRGKIGGFTTGLTLT